MKWVFGGFVGGNASIAFFRFDGHLTGTGVTIAGYRLEDAHRLLAKLPAADLCGGLRLFGYRLCQHRSEYAVCGVVPVRRRSHRP